MYRHLGFFFKKTVSYQCWEALRGSHHEFKAVAPLPDLEGYDQKFVLEFPRTESPEVSVIVSLNKLKETTLPCMVALHQEMFRESSELIIVDNLPLKEKQPFFKRIAGVKVASGLQGTKLASSWNRGGA